MQNIQIKNDLFIQAIKTENLKDIETLLLEGVNANCRDNNDNFLLNYDDPLQYVLRRLSNKSLEIIQTLLKFGANIDHISFNYVEHTNNSSVAFLYQMMNDLKKPIKKLLDVTKFVDSLFIKSIDENMEEVIIKNSVLIDFIPEVQNILISRINVMDNEPDGSFVKASMINNFKNNVIRIKNLYGKNVSELTDILPKIIGSFNHSDGSFNLKYLVTSKIKNLLEQSEIFSEDLESLPNSIKSLFIESNAINLIENSEIEIMGEQ